MYGDVVRKARLARDLTQQELAAITGVGQANISAIEHGRRHPSAETFHRLLLGCGFELVAHAGPREIPVPVPDDDLGDVPADTLPPDLPMADRVRMVTAVLDLASSIVGNR